MQVIALNSREDVFLSMKSALDGSLSLQGTEVTIHPDLLKLSIRLVGEKYDATITTNIMRGVLRLQQMVYDIYSIQKYGEVVKLTREERARLELLVHVGPGSSFLDILFGPVIEVVKDMTGGQKLAAVVTLSVAVVASTGLGGYFDYQKELTKTQAESKRQEGELKAINDTLTATLGAQRDLVRALLREDFSSVELNGAVQKPADMVEATKVKRPRLEVDVKSYTGQFRIFNIRIDESNGLFIDVKHIDSGTVIQHVNILSDFISADDYKWLKDSVDGGVGVPVILTIDANVKAGAIISATLKSIG